MGATVQIDFRIGGADAVKAMTRSISQSLDEAAKSAAKSAAQADRMQLIGARALAANQQTILRGRIATETAAVKAGIAASRTAEMAKTANYRTESQARTSIQRAEIAAATRLRAQDVSNAAASQRQMRALEARAARSETNQRQSAQRAFAGVMGGAVTGGAVKGVSAVTGGAKALVGGVASGADIDASVAHGVKQRIAQERLGVDIINSSTTGSKSVAQRGAEASSLVGQARSVGASTALDPTKILEGIQSYVSFTGDLSSASATMMDMAVLASATGSDFGKLSAAAGSLNGKLKAAGGQFADTAARTKAVNEIMPILAAQGKEGAVELKDQIAGLGTIGGLSGLLTGHDRKSAITQLGALTQVSLQAGTAGNAAEAFTSSRAFMMTFEKQARQKEMNKLGVKTHDKDGNRLALDDQMVELMRATGGDANKMNKAVMDVRAKSVMYAAKSAYDQAGGGDAGLAAVKAQYAPFMKANMTAAEIQEAHNARMETAGARAEIAQQKVDKITADGAERVMASLKKHMAANGEAIAGAVDKGAVLAGWMADNPFQGMGVIVGAYIVKELAGAGLGAAVKALSTPTTAAITGGAVAGLAIGGLVASDIDKGMNRQELAGLDSSNRGMAALGAVSGKTITDEQREQAMQALASMDSAKANRKGFFGNAWEGATAGAKGLMDGEVTAANIASLIPVAALGRAAVQGVVGTQQENITTTQNDAIAADIRAALDKPMQIAPGATIAVSNLSEIKIPEGRAADSQPVFGK